MKTLTIFFFILILTSIVAAAIICIEGRPGWGWFLFVAVLMTDNFSYSEKSK